MGKKFNLQFDSFSNTFALLATDHPREPTACDNDEDHDFLFHRIKGLRTGEVVGFSNEGGDLARDYKRLVELLQKKPFYGLYDVPQLGLRDATLDRIVTAIYRRFILREEGAEYLLREERPVRKVAEK